MMKIFYIFLFCIGIYPAVAQEDTDVVYIKPAQAKEGLKAEVQLIYNQGYLINDNYVIYQEGKSRKIIYPDMQTFQLDDWIAYLMGDKSVVAKNIVIIVVALLCLFLISISSKTPKAIGWSR